jgi:hypothetical protein
VSQIIYYSDWTNNLTYDLEPLRDHFINGMFNGIDDTPRILYCPAFNDHLKNTFVVKATQQYIIEWTGETLRSPMYDQQYFNEYIIPRSPDQGFFSYCEPAPLFVTESDDLMITLESPYFHDNTITRNLFVMPGTFNIGKHFPRTLELAAKFKQPGYVRIVEGDALFYLKFHTDEKITFKKFVCSNELKKLVESNFKVRGHTKGIKQLQWWYNIVRRNNLKKYFLKEVKKNLL